MYRNFKEDRLPLFIIKGISYFLGDIDTYLRVRIKLSYKKLVPRFTLKLKWLQRGAFDKDGEYEWMFKPDLETSRRRFFL
ncbi:unnamed protein product [Rhizophagus irregularis]|nr:unnamed protein product [Rhizophagus irregularis]